MSIAKLLHSACEMQIIGMSATMGGLEVRAPFHEAGCKTSGVPGQEAGHRLHACTEPLHEGDESRMSWPRDAVGALL
jgi:hypothetical protein